VVCRNGLDGCRKPRPTKIRSPECSAHSGSLYQLCYPGPRSTILQHNNSICSEIYWLVFEPCLCRSLLAEICLLWNIFMFKDLYFSVMVKPRTLNVNSDRCQVWVIMRCCAVGWVLPDVSKNRSVFIFRGSSTLELFKRRHSFASQNIWTLSNTALEIPNKAYSRIIACTTLKDKKVVPVIKDICSDSPTLAVAASKLDTHRMLCVQFLISWWRAEKPPETCRALTVIKNSV
jgi:hypothetical protein